MSEIEIKAVTLSQIDEALEERQKPDRRQRSKGVPPDVNGDRRRQDRRAKKQEKI